MLKDKMIPVVKAKDTVTEEEKWGEISNVNLQNLITKILLVLCLTIIFSGCVSFNISHRFATQQDIKLEYHNYAILGNVTKSFEYVNVLGIQFVGFWEHYDLYLDLLSKAQREYRGTDAVVNIVVDRRYKSFLGVINVVEVTLTGIAIHYERAQKNSRNR